MGLLSILDSSAKFHHESTFPSRITFDSALSALRDHDNLIRMDPNLVSYETLPQDPSTPDVYNYSVLDRMEHIPKAIWSQEVHADLCYTNLPNGIRTQLKGPLGLVMDTRFTLEQRKGGELVIVEDVEVRCSRLLLPVIKKECEANWKGIHQRFIEIVAKRQEGKQEESEKVVDEATFEMENVGAPIAA